jgi:phosphatidylinositol glycan class B
MSAVSFLFLLDSVYYGKPTFTPLNFLRTNLSSVSLFYGANPWHYYVTQGIPILCTTSLPFTLYGIWKTVKYASARDTPLRTALATVLWSTTVYSLGGHKEWRFLHPILPLLHLFAAKSLVDLCSPTNKVWKSSSAHPSKRQIFLSHTGLPDIATKYISLIFLTVPASLYVVLFYRDAPISVLSYFRALPSLELGNSTVGFLMPCHSTPGFSFLHRKELANGSMWALGCEPPLQ